MSGSPNQLQVVVLGASPTGLYVVREAAKAGFSVAVVDTGRGCAFHSRHVRVDYRRCIGPLEVLKRWLMTLAASSYERPVLIPTNDVFIEFVVEHYQTLVTGFRLPGVYAGLAAELLDKKQFYNLCRNRGIATPGVWGVDNSRALLALADEVPFPCVLKPSLIHRARQFLKGRKVLVAPTRQRFVELVKAMPEDLGGWLVQEIIPGPESAITLYGCCIDSAGRPQQGFSARKLRQYPPGFGSASLVLSERCEETEARSLAFLEQIGFQGICGTEFKRDSRDGVLKIIEINPRPTLWFQVAQDSGKQIISALLADLTARAMPVEEPQNNAVLWRYALKDTFSALSYLKSPREFVLPKPDVRPAAQVRRRSWPVYSHDDPRPALLEPIGYLCKLWRRPG